MEHPLDDLLRRPMVFAWSAPFAAERAGPRAERLQAPMGLLQNPQKSLGNQWNQALDTTDYTPGRVKQKLVRFMVLVGIKHKDGTL